MLSSREYQVLDLISQGFDQHEIAKTLYISYHTVVSHRRNLLLKLEARTSAQMIRQAFLNGFLQIPAQVA